MGICTYVAGLEGYKLQFMCLIYYGIRLVSISHAFGLIDLCISFHEVMRLVSFSHPFGLINLCISFHEGMRLVSFRHAFGLINLCISFHEVMRLLSFRQSESFNVFVIWIFCGYAPRIRIV